MSVVAVEAPSGAQLLPRPSTPDVGQTIPEWVAVTACNADQRAKFPEWFKVAERIRVRAPHGHPLG